ncbi:MAG TPA: argininosuccinate lyase, partial [Terriglobales bacterium]|nr:argininosuccinate lyase [Terriglobales bacterium]
MKMWSGRFRQPLDPAFESWQRSFEFDCRLLECELEASSAHARALGKAGVLSAEELNVVLHGLEQIGEQAAASPDYLHDPEAEDVHHFVEKRLVTLAGDVGYKLHSGRSRNEQIATDLRLYTRAACDEIGEALATLVSVFLDRAGQADNAAMPAYTHMQRAEPVLIAHWLLAYVEMLLRDRERLEDCRKRANLCPLGSGAVAGSTLALDRNLMAAELGFAAPTANSMDATSDRDFVLEFANSLSLLALHLSRWAEEMLLFSTQEYGFIRLPEAFSTGSSAMPQKMNGDLLELARGKAGRIIGAATALTVSTKGLPLAYNKDLQETQEPLFEAAESVISLLPLVTGWMQSVEFDFERMQKAAETGCMNAFAAATYLARKGVPFRIAHEQVGKAVRLALDKGCELEGLSLDDLQSIDNHFADDFYDFVKLENVLAIHDVPGGTAPARV